MMMLTSTTLSQFRPHIETSKSISSKLWNISSGVRGPLRGDLAFDHENQVILGLDKPKLNVSNRLLVLNASVFARDPC